MGTRRDMTGRETGSALIAAVGIMLVLSVLAIAAFSIADENLFASQRGKASAMALHNAEAGLDVAMWRIRTIGSAIAPTFTVDTPTGHARVTAVPISGYQYAVTSTGTSDLDPRASRVLTSKVFYVSLWNFVMGAGSLAAGGGGALTGNTSVRGPFYVRGNLPLSGATRIDDGPLFVRKGDISITGSAQIGTGTAEHIDVFCDGVAPTPDTNAFYANLNISVPDLQLPPLRTSELQARRSQARLESLDNYLGTRPASLIANNEVADNVQSPGRYLDQYKVIDVDDIVNGNAPTLVFDATTPSFGNANDDFAWDAGTGTVYVRGTVYVDGPVRFDVVTRYVGNGNIVANGNITVNETLLPLGVYPSEDALGLTTPMDIICNAGGGNNPHPQYADADMAGAWYAGNQIYYSSNIVVRGSVLTSRLVFQGNNNHILTDPQLPDYLPPSMPGGTDRVVFPTRWHEGYN